MKRALAFALAISAGCAQKSAPSDQFTDLAGLDEKSDAFSYRMKILGTLAYGDPAVTARYTPSPRFRALRFDGQKQDSVSIWVRSKNGDPVAWLLDARYNVVTSNDDESDTSTDSHLATQLPADGRYYIVLRDYYLASHNFTVTLAPAKRRAPCAVGFDVNDEPPVPVSDVEWLSNNYPGSFKLTDGFEPECLDFHDPNVQKSVAADLLGNKNRLFNDTTDPVTLGSITPGAAAFDDALLSMKNEIGGFNASTGWAKPAAWADLYPKLDADLASIVGDSRTNPSAYIEFNLHMEAEECSQEGHVRVDLRTGQILIFRTLGC